MSEELKKEWEREFDRNFPIKEFRDTGAWYACREFISSLLAEQQEELRDMLIRKSVAIDMGGISTRIVNLDSVLEDIKSKLNK
jgi:hypothetical protein